MYIGANLFAQIPTAVNIKGVFNTSNETKYETEVPDGRHLSLHFLADLVLHFFNANSASTCLVSGISIDFNFYRTLWSLQVGIRCFVLLGEYFRLAKSVR